MWILAAFSFLIQLPTPPDCAVELRAALEELNKISPEHGPIEHPVVSAAKAREASKSGNFLEAAAYHSVAYYLFLQGDDSQSAIREAEAAGLHYLVQYELSSEASLGRKAADFFARAGKIQTAAMLYEDLGDPEAAEHILRFQRDQFTRSPAPGWRPYGPRQSTTQSSGIRRLPPEIEAALELFGLDSRATKDQVKARYRERVMEVHPDRHPDVDPQKIVELVNAKIILREYGFY